MIPMQSLKTCLYGRNLFLSHSTIYLMMCAPSKNTDQPAYSHRKIKVFYCLKKKKKSLNSWLVKSASGRLIRQCECSDWTESLLGAQVKEIWFSRCPPFLPAKCYHNCSRWNLIFLLLFFSEKIKHDISQESSARLMIHVKGEILLLLFFREIRLDISGESLGRQFTVKPYFSTRQ